MLRSLQLPDFTGALVARDFTLAIYPRQCQILNEREESRGNQMVQLLLSLNLKQKVPLFLYTCSYKASLAEDTENGISSSPVLPVRHDLPALPKPQNPNFEFQDGRKLKRSILNWKALQTTDLKSMIRRGKRTLNTPVSYC